MQNATNTDMADIAETLGTTVSALEEAAHIYNIPGYASGGQYSGGLAMVGEKGAEFINTNPGMISSNNDSQNMLKKANKDVVIELREMRKENAEIKLDLKVANKQIIKLLTKVNNREEKYDETGTPDVRAA
jgi:hypothetical protein